MTEKEIFIEKMKNRTKKFGVDVILFCDSLKPSKAYSVITYQLVKSHTSVGSNYRSACRGRSDKEFFSKICIVVEEADESVFWLEVIRDTGLSGNNTKMEKLLAEGIEILKITTKSKDTTYKKLKLNT